MISKSQLTCLQTTTVVHFCYTFYMTVDRGLVGYVAVQFVSGQATRWLPATSQPIKLQQTLHRHENLRSHIICKYAIPYTFCA